jgi:hypothetical protein
MPFTGNRSGVLALTGAATLLLGLILFTVAYITIRRRTRAARR